jgi:hypothetical protein
MLGASHKHPNKIASSHEQTFKQTVIEALIHSEARPNVLANRALQGSHSSNFQEVCSLCRSNVLENERFQRCQFASLFERLANVE